MGLSKLEQAFEARAQNEIDKFRFYIDPSNQFRITTNEVLRFIQMLISGIDIVLDSLDYEGCPAKYKVIANSIKNTEKIDELEGFLYVIDKFFVPHTKEFEVLFEYYIIHMDLETALESIHPDQSGLNEGKYLELCRELRIFHNIQAQY